MAAFDTRRFGEIAVDLGFVTSDKLAAELTKQRRLLQQEGRQVPLGDMLVQDGLISAAQRAQILNRQAGGQIIGSYTLLSKLGSGGMGSVYKARQEGLNRIVALKILAHRLAQQESAVRQFQREARLVARLNHPNIVAGIDVGEDKGVHYFAMEFVAGPNLADLLSGARRLKVATCLDILEQVAAGLAHAEARAIIHRDVKPGNMIVIREKTSAGSFYRVKITDLGLGQTRSMSEEDKENVGFAQGTPNYIAPEQVRGELNQDFRVDMYALGLTAYRMLVGRTPFEGRTAQEIRQAHLNMVVPSPHDLLPQEIPLDLCRVLEAMAAKNPADRYASYSDMIADLNAIRSSTPIARPPLKLGESTIAPPQKSSGRRSGLVASSPLNTSAIPTADTPAFDPGSPTPKSPPEPGGPKDSSAKRRTNIRRFRRR
ncbi:MAG: protein kinase domain-containing protein [Planctomycetota bacterium]